MITPKFTRWTHLFVFALFGLALACGLGPTTSSTPTATPVMLVVVTPTLTGTPSQPPSPTPTSPTSLTPTLPPSLTPTPPPAQDLPTSGQGLLFGPFHLPESEFGATYTGAFRSLRPNNALAILEAARAADLHLIINLTGSRRRFQEPDGAFSLDRFQELLGHYRRLDFAPYVADGTIIGHMMFDEPQDPSNWNGAPIPYADIEAAAAYSKELWPAMPVGVGGPPDFLQAGAPWAALDFAFAQYTTRRGDLATWLPQQVQAAQQAQLGLVLSLNILGGNDRSPVTAAQLTDWGTQLLAEPYACALLMWKFDPTYLQDPAIAAAMADLAQLARDRPAPPCQIDN